MNISISMRIKNNNNNNNNNINNSKKRPAITNSCQLMTYSHSILCDGYDVIFTKDPFIASTYIHIFHTYYILILILILILFWNIFICKDELLDYIILMGSG